ncbi:PREDICTED: uncharacterized protein LOC108566795 [Nicrophorus vespilloides]|uniref:Uncharacterized protein LOC108566795 n=1 Tax=Nicrophorus vespilloides TaxID=110193 RepID=A0ABM1N6A1_NICVS|nr:PREDICTED: uncharacterized protein LOC108566795 [Nicrophorus vespilloides]
MKSLTVGIALALVVLVAICDPTRSASLQGRVKRQGWNWGEGGSSVNRPTRPSRTTTTTTTTTTVAPTTPVQGGGDGGAAGGTTTTTPSPAYTRCLSSCASTPQYNPVCGSNRVTYDNIGRLNCARRCGSDVTMLFNGTCGSRRRR